MSRIVLYILLIGFLGCDTSNNIKPLGEAYFIKFYGTIGDQEGVSVKSTPDGGYIIGGNSIAEFEGESDFLLVKVDAFGNQEWAETYDLGGDEKIIETVVEANGYVFAGSTIVGGVSTIVIIRVDLLGQNRTESDFSSIATKYRCQGLSKTGTGEFIIVGDSLLDNSNIPQGRSIIIVINNDLSENRHQFEGDATNWLSFKRGLEVLNHDEINYLVVANSLDGSALYQYRSDLSTPTSSEQTISPDTQIGDILRIDDSQYMVLTTTLTETELSLVSAVNSEEFFKASNGSRIRVEELLHGVSFALNQNNKYVVASNVIDGTSLIRSSSILETNFIGNVDWNRNFGTDFSFTSGEVIISSDGSIVYTGTAGLKDQNKVFLIKMKSNGEMK